MSRHFLKYPVAYSLYVFCDLLGMLVSSEVVVMILCKNPSGQENPVEKKTKNNRKQKF